MYSIPAIIKQINFCLIIDFEYLYTQYYMYTLHHFVNKNILFNATVTRRNKYITVIIGLHNFDIFFFGERRFLL